ncbi:putative 3-phosphoinositide-dependent protein kinase 2 isoform X2 [Chrysoperla carnea]|uniref:putative 3-phosphoinositide-dependent protein kinase 2 isoform X2 n=1 Tax=Chrysoperla carnea TaxID=189513 RepID=UPI001D068007|nr:putative 3-phosphoinositide-dependent protein kinase 2 isoform X2 [Chrysoperla carnea]
MADGDNELTGAAVGVSQSPSKKTTDNDTKSNSSTINSAPIVITNNTNKILEQKLSVDKINNMTPTPTNHINRTPKQQTTELQQPQPSAKKTANDFIFGKTLGDGSFSTVYLAKEVHTKKEFAIKVCDKSHIIREKKQQYILREKEALNMLVNDPYFVKLYCTFHDDRKLYFVLTYAKNGDLLQLIKRLGSLDMKLTQYYTCELVIALEALKAKGIIHRDLKPENILLDENFNILITDFGSTKILKQEPLINNTDQSQSEQVPRRRNSFVGTANYVSPELLTDKLTTHACDLWALGCVIYQMLTGKLCFLAGSDHLIFNKILNRQYEYPDNFSNVASDLIDKLLVIEADQRLGASDSVPYASIRNHPFFDDVIWDNIGGMPPSDSLEKVILDKNEEGDEKDCFEKAEPGLNNRQMARLVGLSMDSSESTLIYDGSVESLNLDNNQTKNGKEDKRKNIADLTPIQIETRLSMQRRSSKYHDLVEGNLILKQGLLDKKKGIRPRRRMFLLTLGPHIYYVDPQTMVLKGQIPWTEDLRVEVKHFRKFDIVTPNRTYLLEDPEGYALQWQQDIEDVHEFYFNKKP